MKDFEHHFINTGCLIGLEPHFEGRKTTCVQVQCLPKILVSFTLQPKRRKAHTSKILNFCGNLLCHKQLKYSLKCCIAFMQLFEFALLCMHCTDIPQNICLIINVVSEEHNQLNFDKFFSQSFQIQSHGDLKELCSPLGEFP